MPLRDGQYCRILSSRRTSQRTRLGAHVRVEPWINFLRNGEQTISIYIIESLFVCLFVCLFAINAKTTERIDAKRSEITKNYPESVLCGFNSPVLVLSGRYNDISGFSLAADRHIHSCPLPALPI